MLDVSGILSPLSVFDREIPSPFITSPYHVLRLRYIRKNVIVRYYVSSAPHLYMHCVFLSYLSLIIHHSSLSLPDHGLFTCVLVFLSRLNTCLVCRWLVSESLSDRTNT